jgi:hypothetical protein
MMVVLVGFLSLQAPSCQSTRDRIGGVGGSDETCVLRCGPHLLFMALHARGHQPCYWAGCPRSGGRGQGHGWPLG